MLHDNKITGWIDTSSDPVDNITLQDASPTSKKLLSGEKLTQTRLGP